jgi:hypothetical protein
VVGIFSIPNLCDSVLTDRSDRHQTSSGVLPQMSIEHAPGRGQPKLMTRRQLAEYLKSEGYPIAFGTLNKICAPSKNLGPEAEARWGNKIILYSPSKALEWAQSRIRPVTA